MSKLCRLICIHTYDVVFYLENKERYIYFIHHTQGSHFGHGLIFKLYTCLLFVCGAFGSFFLSCGSQGMNSGSQAWLQVLLPTETSHQSVLHKFIFEISLTNEWLGMKIKFKQFSHSQVQYLEVT